MLTYFFSAGHWLRGNSAKATRWLCPSTSGDKSPLEAMIIATFRSNLCWVTSKFWYIYPARFHRISHTWRICSATQPSYSLWREPSSGGQTLWSSCYREIGSIPKETEGQFDFTNKSFKTLIISINIFLKPNERASSHFYDLKKNTKTNFHFSNFS